MIIFQRNLSSSAAAGTPEHKATPPAFSREECSRPPYFMLPLPQVFGSSYFPPKICCFGENLVLFCLVRFSGSPLFGQPRPRGREGYVIWEGGYVQASPCRRTQWPTRPRAPQVHIWAEAVGGVVSGLIGRRRRPPEADVPTHLHVAHLSRPVRAGEPFQVWGRP